VARTRLLRERLAVLTTPPPEASKGIGPERTPPSVAEDIFSAVHLEKQSPGPGLIRGRRLSFTVASLLLAASVAIGTLFLSGALTSRAIQDPTISLDMITTGTTYDSTTNTLTVGAIDNTSTGSSTVTHP